MPFGAEEPVECWDDYLRKVHSLHSGWVFRGGLRAWNPETSLERVCTAWGIGAEEIPEAERRLVTDFRRHPEARHLDIEASDYLGWFAAMQHHGAPTRLLDWTYSPFVAEHFAFDALFTHRESSTDPEPAKAAVWAIDTGWLNERLTGVLSREERSLYENRNPESFKCLYVTRSPPASFVSVETPMLLHERLSIQQGLFLCPGDVSQT